MKKHIALTVLAAVLVGGALVVFIQAATNSSPQTIATVQCQGQHAAHSVTIKNNTLSPVHTQAKLCDTLTITNQDDVLRLLAFGPHDHHTPYDGVAEKLLQKGQSVTVTLNQAGSFTFHDHLHDSLIGYFTVSK